MDNILTTLNALEADDGGHVSGHYADDTEEDRGRRDPRGHENGDPDDAEGGARRALSAAAAAPGFKLPPCIGAVNVDGESAVASAQLASEEVLKQKTSELMAARQRLAQLQSIRNQMQELSGVTGLDDPPSRRRAEGLTPSGLHGEDAEDAAESESDPAVDAAAVSQRMRSVYETKLEEQEAAVEQLRQERLRLLTIREQVVKLQETRSLNECPPERRPRDAQPVGELGALGVTAAAAAAAAAAAEQLNNARHHGLPHPRPEHGSMEGGRRPAPGARSRREVGPGGAVREEDEDDGDSASIISNPRLASFRRNNQLQNRSRSAPQTARSGEAPAEHPQQQCQAPPAAQPKSAREASSVEQHYQLLQNHIESIRSIFEDLIRREAPSSSRTTSVPPQAQQPPLLSPPPGSANWDLNSALAVQQQQLMVSLLMSCQQQLSQQQMEMRYLQQVCQDLASNRDSASVVGDQQQLHHSLPPSLGMPPVPLDGRPLSSASLYNLLAPNPYLTMPYYPAQLQQPTVLTSPPSMFGQAYGGLNNTGAAAAAAAQHQLLQQTPPGGAPARPFQNLSKSTTPAQMVANNFSPLHQSYGSGGGGQAEGGKNARPQPFPQLDLNQSFKSNVGDRKRKNVGEDEGASAVGGGMVEASSVLSVASTTGSQATSTNAKASRGGPAPGTEHFDTLRETIYAEVAALISQNEQRPQFLLDLFRELQLLSSDYLRSRALDAVRETLNRYLTEDTDPGDTDTGDHRWTASGFPSTTAEGTPTESAVTSEEDEADKENRTPRRLSAVARAGAAANRSPYTSSSAAEAAAHPEKGKKFEHLVDIQDVKGPALNNSAQGRAQPAPRPARNIERIQNRAEEDSTEEKNVDVAGLEQQIQSIVDELIPFLKENVDAECSPQLLQYLRKLVLTLATGKCVPPEKVSEFFSRQLSTILDDTLAKFQNQKLRDCGEELLADVSEVVFNELAFFRLMQNLDSLSHPRRQPPQASALGDGNEGASESSASRPSSPSPPAESAQDKTPSREDVPSEPTQELSARTAVSISNMAVHMSRGPDVPGPPARSTNGNAGGRTAEATEPRARAVEVVLTDPLTVQVTAATDDDRSTATSSAPSRGGRPEGLREAADGGSRDTTPPEDLPESEEVQEQVEDAGQEDAPCPDPASRVDAQLTRGLAQGEDLSADASM